MNGYYTLGVKLAVANFLVREMRPEDERRFRLRPDVNLREKQFQYRIALGPKGDLAGFATLDPKDSSIRNLWVQPEFRRQGVAKRLLESFNQPPQRLEVRKDNEAAQELYRRLGFKRAGEADSRHDVWTRSI